jgi:SAM-dependent methyltransferase
LRNGFRNEDLEAQTFEDESFDLVVTQDVFEHVFHPDKAIKEIARTLSTGGAHICTVPIVKKSMPSSRRASLVDGQVIHHVPPEFHGNPVDDAGALVTIDWGYDIAGYLSNASGLVSTLHHIDDLSRGIRAEFIEVMVNAKLGSSAL